MNSLDFLIFAMGSVGLFCIFMFFAYATYLARRWLPSVEMTMTGHNVHTANWFFAIHAVILFGSVFAWDWHARRQKSVFDDRDWSIARENVPLPVRRKFIFAFSIFILGSILAFSAAGMLKLLEA